MTYPCPVCGYPDLEEPPWNPVSGASYEICPSCGFEFGFTDESEGHSYGEWRARWIGSGMQWWSSSPAPPNWEPVEQVASLEGQLGPGRGA